MTPFQNALKRIKKVGKLKDLKFKVIRKNKDKATT